MEKELQRLINNANEDNLRLENKVENLRNKIIFCQEHNFSEETRIALVELNAIEMPAYRQRKIIDELQDVLNKWNS